MLSETSERGEKDLSCVSQQSLRAQDDWEAETPGQRPVRAQTGEAPMRAVFLKQASGSQMWVEGDQSTQAGPAARACHLYSLISPSAQKGPTPAVMLCCHHLEILNIFFSQGPAFSFVAGSVSRDRSREPEPFSHRPGQGHSTESLVSGASQVLRCAHPSSLHIQGTPTTAD